MRNMQEKLAPLATAAVVTAAAVAVLTYLANKKKKSGCAGGVLGVGHRGGMLSFRHQHRLCTVLSEPTCVLVQQRHCSRMFFLLRRERLQPLESLV